MLDGCEAVSPVIRVYVSPAIAATDLCVGRFFDGSNAPTQKRIVGGCFPQQFIRLELHARYD